MNHAYLERANEKGVVGVWTCKCGAKGTLQELGKIPCPSSATEEDLVAAIQGSKKVEEKHPSPQPSALEFLSDLSGLPENTIRAITDEVIANNRLLKGCAGHVFSIEMDQERPRLLRRWKCTYCTGWVTARGKEKHG